MRTPLMWLIAVALVFAGAGCAREMYLRTPPPVLAVAHEQQAAAPASPPAPEYSSLVGTYCVTCHNDTLKTAGLSLQSLGLSNVPEHAEVWEKVARKLRSGEMPPATVRSRPDSRMAGALVTYLETTLDRAAVVRPNPGRAPRSEQLNEIAV